MSFKQADSSEFAKALGMGVGVPMLASLGMNAAMGDSMATVPNPHQKGLQDVSMYKPVLAATNRVRAGKGSMLDHMQAYRHPGQVQAHPLYGPINRMGPKLMGGLQQGSKFMWGNGPLQGALAGGVGGVGVGLLGNALMRAMGKSDTPYWKAMLLGGGLGSLVGGGGAAFRDNTVSNYFKGASVIPEEEEVERESGGLPLALTAGLGGMGAAGLAYAMTDDGRASRALDQIRQYNPEAFSDPSALPEGHTDLTYYEKMLSPAAQLTMFGRPVGDALVKIRSNEGIMKRLGTESYTLRDSKAQEGASGRQHYEMFARGPVAAYMHQMKSKFHDTEVPRNLGVARGTTYTDWMGRKFEDFVAQRAGQRINPYEVTTDFMPQEEQAKLMEDFHHSLTPKERAYRLKTEDLPGEQYSAQTRNYMPKAERYLKLRNTLKQVGGTGMGAAIGGAMGHLMHDQLRGENEDNTEKRDWAYWVSTLGGAGAGGLIGNHIAKAMNKSSAWRSPGMDSGQAQGSINSILSMLSSAPGLSFNQRSQLMSGVGQLDPSSAQQLKTMLGTGGGAAVGAVVARFLMGKGLGSTVVGALLGGVIGNAIFGQSGPRTAAGNIGLSGVDFSGRPY